MKRHDPIFWLENRCPFCNHVAPSVYRPDLLNGPIEFECQSRSNWFRRNDVCHGWWSVALDPDYADELRRLMNLAEEVDRKYKEIKCARVFLGYKD